MRRVLRENVLCALFAAAGCSAIGWLGLYGASWNDYEVEVRPAFEALSHGHIHDFLRLAPVYGGSLIERASFALLPGLWHGGPLAVYRLAALPCLLAAAVLGVWLVARMRAERRPLLARAVALGVCVANPIALRALEVGHPEELLGACMCVAAMLLAGAPAVGRRRALAIGLLLGLAVANKQWAALAVAPVLLALPPGRRLACLTTALGSAALVEAPFLLGASGSFLASTGGAAAPGSAVFQPWQLWWFLGHHGALVHGLYGVPKPGYRIGPAWAGAVSHPLIPAAALALAGALWVRTRGARMSSQQAMLALAVTLLGRCLLDTWDIDYYMLPAILALLAWESGRPGEQPPVIALSISVLAWVSFQWLPAHASPDVQSAAFLAWTAPLTCWLATRLLGGPRPAASREPRGGRGPLAQEMTVSSLGRPVSTSRPSGRTTARSSIRTPSASGR